MAKSGPTPDPATEAPEPDPADPNHVIARGQVVQSSAEYVIIRTGLVGECGYDVKPHDATPGAWVNIYADGTVEVSSPSVRPFNIPVPSKPEPPEAA